MSNFEGETREKIVLSARELFFSQGIKKTSIEEIAHHAGVSRITVYRYFADKRDLVQAAFLRGEQVFQDGLKYLEQNSITSISSFLNKLGEDLSALPSGDLIARVNELKRLYPDLYADLQSVRIAALNGIFDHLFSMAESQGLLRPGVNRQIFQAIFWESIINIFEKPGFNSFGLSNDELFHVVSDMLLYGILKD